MTTTEGYQTTKSKTDDNQLQLHKIITPVHSVTNRQATYIRSFTFISKVYEENQHNVWKQQPSHQNTG